MPAKSFNLKAIISLQDRISRPLARINRVLGRQRQAFGAVARAAGGVVRALAPVGIAAAGLAALTGAGVAALNRLADAADRVAKTARAIRFPGKELQRWSYIADRSGVANETLVSGLEAFTKRMGEARAATGGLYTYLQKTSPALMKQLLAAEGNEQAFRALMTALAGTTDAQNRAALSAAAFSRGAGLDMVKVAAAGKDEIEALGRRFDELGGGYSQELLDNSEIFKDLLTDIAQVVKSVTNIFGEALLPVLRDVTTSALDWLKANRDLVKGRLAEYARGLAESLRAIAAAIPGIVRGFDEWIEKNGGLQTILTGVARQLGKVYALFERIGGIKALLVAVAAVIVGPLLAAIASLGVALAALGVASLPVIAAIAGIAAGAALIYASWDGIKAFLADPWTGLGKLVQAELDAVVGAFEWMRDAVSPVLEWLSTQPGLRQAWAEVGAFFERVMGQVSGAFQSAYNTIKPIIDWLVQQVERLKGIIDSVKSISGRIGSAVSGAASKVGTWFGAEQAAAGPQAEPAAGKSVTPQTESVRDKQITPPAARTRLDGEMTVKFENAPPGMRATPGKTNQPGVQLNPEVGYRSPAMGLP